MTRETITVRGHLDDRDFLVLLIKKGDRYGRDMCLTNDGDPLVSFYDKTYHHDDDEYGNFLGQHTGGTYYVKTLLDRDEEYGLNLYGGAPEWAVNVDEMKKVHEWMREVA